MVLGDKLLNATAEIADVINKPAQHDVAGLATTLDTRWASCSCLLKQLKVKNTGLIIKVRQDLINYSINKLS